jgi:hypothetical protein
MPQELTMFADQSLAKPMTRSLPPAMKLPGSFKARPTCLVLAIAAALPFCAMAQGIASPATPVQSRLGLTSPLYPLASVDQVAAPQRPTAFKGTVDSADGKTGPVDYSVNELAAKLVVVLDRNGVPADGQSPVAVTLQVLGADGKRLANAVWATLEISGGRILLPGAATDEAGPRGNDADRTTPGIQVLVKDGLAKFTLLAPINPQDVLLRVTVGKQVASGIVSFVPEMRDMVAAGLIEGVINFGGKSSGLIDGTPRNDGFEREITAWSRAFNDGKSNVAARTAMFLKGTIKGEYLLTATYDSDKETRARALKDITPEQFYPVYGDASIKGLAPASDSRLYVRIDKNKSYLLYGDFATGDGFSQLRGGGNVAGLQQRSLGATNRSATGIRYHYEEGNLTGNLFAFRDSLRQVVEEFASQGSGPYGLRNNAVLEGSEKIEVVTRDRNQPARILSVRPLQRLADYTFEPFSGRIVLSTFLSSFDPDLNPVSLRVSYEVDQGGDVFWVWGADGQLRINDTVEVGGSVMRDENPLAPQQLASANIGLQLAPRTRLVVEVANSTGDVNTNSVNTTTQPGLVNRSGSVSGNAWRIELAHQQDNAELRAFFGRSDPEFNNPSAPLSGGRGEANVRGSLQLSDTLKLYGAVQRSDDLSPGAAQTSSAQLGLNAQLTERLTLDVGLRALRESAGTVSGGTVSPFALTSGMTSSLGSGSGGGAVGFGNQSLNPVNGLPIIQPGNSILGAFNSTNAGDLNSNSLRVGLGFKATDRFSLGGEIEQSVSGDARQRYALGADYRVAERTRLYGRLERQTGLASPDLVTTNSTNSNALVFGVDSTYLRDTQLFSEYRLRDALSGSDVQMASGVRNTWDYAPGVRLNTALERTQVVSGTSPETTALAVGVDYTANPLWSGSTKLELRRSGDIAGTPDDESFNTTLWQIMAARKLDRDWTFLARNYRLQTDYATRGDVSQNRFQLGLAYRDTDTNRVNALAKLEFKNERDASNATVGTLSSRATILSTHADWHPKRPWWITGRLAAKWQEDQFEGGVQDNFSAQLVAGRVVYDISENWDIGAMVAAQFGQSGARQTAAGLELGYLVRQNLWLSLGYNQTGFTGDRDLVGYEYTQSGFYLRLRFKFDENLFARDNPNVNRSLDRPTAKP